MKKLFPPITLLYLFVLPVSLFLLIPDSFSQEVDNKSCPYSYKRNNGNGQFVSVFASNITTGSIYFANALKSNNQGNFTFSWESNIKFPPVINKTWTTSEAGLTTQNWAFGNNSSGSPFNPPGVPSGTDVMYTFYNNNLPTAGSITIELADPITGLPFTTCTYPLTNGNKSISLSSGPTIGVSSGKSGGLESESIGTALADQVFKNTTQGVASKVNYKDVPLVSDYARLRTDGLGILSFMPDQEVLGSSFIGYITSPNDILAYTNAEEVISVDYVSGGVNKAVAFCTKTFNGIYSHTKPVCDRLKESELTSVDTLRYGGYKFLICYFKTKEGVNEYAISFSAGFDQQDSFYSLQSEWITSSYMPQETMYNFQLWSSDLSLLNSMINNILLKLNRDKPLKQIGPVKKPFAFITKAFRDSKNQLSLKMDIFNESSATSGVLELSGKENEQSKGSIIQRFPITLSPFGISSASLPVNDLAEAEIKLYLNGVGEDVIYNSDGIWNMYTPAGTQIREYQVFNDTEQPSESEYRIFRNVKLDAVTSEYVTIYRMVKGGGIAADLSAFNFLKFNASGNSNVRIRLIKESVVRYEDQYQYVLPLKAEKTDYIIPISDFKSLENSGPLSIDDLVTISFSYEATSPGTQLAAELSNVRFSEFSITPGLMTPEIIAFPNPAKARLNLAFESKESEIMNLELISASTGTVILFEEIQTRKGMNNYTSELNPAYSPGLYIVRLHSGSQKFTSKLIIK